MENRLHPLRTSQRLLSYLVCALIAWQPLLPALSATMTPVTAGTKLDKAANGVPVINIATPNGAGISHNQFKEYNVGKEGVILNNATGQLTKTQLGGLIQNNTNLKAGQEAKGIINEVTGGSRSQLQGYTEVAGKGANVIVANPYGITCNGCGFINTPNVTLTTGKPQLDAKGNLQSLEVTRGTITVEGQGIDASQSDALSIISRATEVNAAIHARDLKVIAGANRVAADGTSQAVAGEGAAPRVAVDTGALGGMYANRIRLVSSEKGVGVNLGDLNARQGDISLDASGKITLNKSLSSGALEVRGQSIVLNGDNKATGPVALNAAQDITLAAGTVVSDETISLTGNGKLAVSSGKLTAGKNIQLHGGDLLVDKASAGNAAGDIQLTAQKQIDNAGQLTAGKGLLLKAQQAQNSGALVAKAAQQINADALTNKGQVVGDSLSVTTHTLANSGEMLGGALTEINTDLLQQSGTLSSQGSTKITADSLDNRAGGAITAKKSLVTASSKLVNQGTLSALELTLNSTQIENNGLIQGNDLLKISSNQLTNQLQGILTSAHDFALDLPDLHNSGLITSDAALAFSGNSLVNTGEISAASLTASNSSLINQQDGLLISDAGMQLNLQQLTNNGQVVASELEITAAGVNNSGLLQGSGAVRVSGENMTNAGTLLSGGQLALQAKTLNNQGLLQGQQLTLKSESWQNSGNALSEEEAEVNTGSLTNSGRILGQQGIQLQSDTTDNQGWLIAQALTLRGDLINSGLIQGNDSLALEGKNLRNQATGQLLSAGALTLDGTTLVNLGTLQADRLTLSAQNWQNGGSTRASSQLKAQVSGSVGNSGSLLSEQGLTLYASEILNQGTLAADRLNLSAPLLTNGGLLQGNSELTLNTTSLTNQAGGKLLGGGALNLMLEQINNDGLLQVNDALTVTGSQFTNNGRVQADTLLTHLSDTFTNGSGAQLLAQQQVDINARKLNNRGTVAANQLKVSGDELINSGLLQGDESLTTHFQQLSNQSGGQLLSGGELSVTGGSASNDGSWQGDRLGFELTTLANRGAITGTHSLNGDASSELNNSGMLLSQGAADLSAPTLLNSGKIMASGLTLQGGTLNNSGLWQGSDSLAVQAESLTIGTAGKALSGGALTLKAGQLTTSGTLQGERAEITADSWQQQGSVLGSGELTARVSGELRNIGELLSQGEVLIGAQTLTNSGSLLSSQAMTLTGDKLTNSGAIQGKTVRLSQANVINQGSLIGLQALTLAALPQMAGSMIRMALAAPARELVNSSAGTMLTQGTLTVKGGTVTNNGSWQGQQILLEAGQLINNGSIQSADGLQLNLTDKLTSNAGSKITANGVAALQALALTNQGQWIAKSLTLTGSTLNNNGDISGVDALTVKLDGGFTQQQNKTLLSAGKLTLEAASVTNSGNVQGQEVTLTSGAVNNSGRLQGDNNLLMTLSGRMTNNASGTLVSQKALTLTTPELYNYGLIQSGATSTIKATGLASNSGKLLSGGELTLNTPQLTNSGWLQATRLILNAANAANSGTLLADQQATLSGSALSNQGSAQGANLVVNYQQLSNSGTLLGTQQLNVTASQVNQQAAGKLFSGGTLTVNSNGFDQLGQVVALGDATLKIINAFTAKGVLAAGNRLSVSSNGALENQGTMQGQALTVSAGGLLTNNGQLTSGSGDSSLSGSGIIMNGNGSLQGGGNLTLTSRSDVTLNGFTGTRGSLTISTPGSLVNTALLYAANNLFLFANSIQNKRGDILAGNNLTLQRDAAGNANGEVVNTSGTIETQKGDIKVNTGHLLNERAGLATSSKKTVYIPADNMVLSVLLSSLDPEDITYGISLQCAGKNDHCSEHYYYQVSNPGDRRKTLISTEENIATSEGGAASIRAGKNVIIAADILENKASDIISGGDAFLSGTTLSNSSYYNNKLSNYGFFITPCDGSFSSCRFTRKENETYKADAALLYELDGDPFSEQEASGGFRAVIQAGGNVSANFSGDISNTSTMAHVGWGGNTLAKPGLNSFNAPGGLTTVQRQQLTAAGKVTVNSPQWRDQLQSALQQVNGGTALDGASATGIALTNRDVNAVGSTNLGKAADLKAIATNGSQALLPYQASRVDTSAYPLPSGNNGYFVASSDSKSPYLITVNPKLNGLGQLDQSLFGDLNALLGKRPGNAPQETRTQYTDTNAFLGSSYLLDRLNLKPDYDYRFLGDAAFDTRYVSNVVLNQTGSRYLNGLGSELDQMRYLMDNAAAAQQSLGLQFGVSLSADQLAALDKSIIWWEASTVNGETVMVPKVYLSPKDVSLQSGSVIAGNNVSLKAGTITNSGSTIAAKNDLKLDSENQLSNLSAGLMQAGGDLQLSALGDINNVGSTISGKTVALESVNGDINNLTTTQQLTLNASNNRGASKSFTETLSGPVASIAALDSLSLKAGNDINITGANVKAGGNLLMDAWNNIAVTSNQLTTGNAQSGVKNGWRKIDDTSTSTTSNQGSVISAGGNLAMQAGHNLDVTASAINAGGNATLGAGNDINLNSAATTQNSQQGKSESHASGLDRTTLTSGNDLLLKAGRDLNSDAAGMAAENDIALQAGRDLNLLAAETRSGNSYKAGKKVEINDAVRQQGTELASGGNTTLAAGRDINSEAAQVKASKDIAVTAGQDINLTTATDSDYHYKEETKTKKSFLKKTTTHKVEENSSTTE
ncbi:filamentous hemagglutinin N-terminal domain-containing protein [Erwinia sp. P7711]|uniref:two-partner secretion domain-containing protein n=1 Tax=Erwinia sp. P7711 TaxID=3141451 RepID=UPI003187921E